MITVAILRGEPAGDTKAEVAGLTVLLRQLLSLQDAGVKTVVVEALGSVPRDARLSLRVVATREADDTGPALFARPGLVWHPALPRRLANGTTDVDLEKAPLRPGEFVVKTATRAERAEAERLLLRTLFKPTDGMISRALNRRVSLWVTRHLLGTAVTPNQMTAVAAVFGLAGIAAVFAWGMRGLIPGALLVQMQSILDGCDGELSRLKYLRSRVGEWLDQVLDDVVNLGHFAAVGFTLYQAGSVFAGWVAVVGVVAHLVYQASLYVGLVTRAGGSGSTAALQWWGQKAQAAPPPDTVPDARVSPLRYVKEFVELAGRRDFFTFFYVPAAIFGFNIAALFWAGFIFTFSGLTTGLQWLVGGGPKPS